MLEARRPYLEFLLRRNCYKLATALGIIFKTRGNLVNLVLIYASSF